MKMVLGFATLCASLIGCTVVSHPDDEMVRTIERENARVDRMLEAKPAPPANDSCPPLPEIPEGASREEGRLFTFTLIALYEQCAKSKR